jgi:hypothetical protein
MLNSASTLLVLFCLGELAGADKQAVAEAGTEFSGFYGRQLTPRHHDRASGERREIHKSRALSVHD